MFEGIELLGIPAGSILEFLGAVGVAISLLHGILITFFAHTSFLDEERENAILNFIGNVAGRLSAFNNTRRKP